MIYFKFLLIRIIFLFVSFLIHYKLIAQNVDSCSDKILFEFNVRYGDISSHIIKPILSPEEIKLFLYTDAFLIIKVNIDVTTKKIENVSIYSITYLNNNFLFLFRRKRLGKKTINRILETIKKELMVVSIDQYGYETPCMKVVGYLPIHFR